MLQSMGSQRVGHDWMTERLNNNNTNDHVTESLNSHNPIHFSHEISVYPFLMKKLKLEYSVIKNPPANAGEIRDADLIPGSGRAPDGGHGNSLQYSFLMNPHG